MSPLLSTLIVLAGLTGASSNGPVAQPSARPVSVQVSTSPLVTGTVVSSADVIGDPLLPEQAQENVLVVPTPDLPAESLADLTEDLSIMCRIFDKSLPAPSTSINFAYGDRPDPFRWVVAQQGRGSQGLYLDGYGALFFLRVDFPMVPTDKQEAAQAKPTEPVDSVWSQTIKEMSGQPGEEPPSARNAPVYDAQKVESLKQALIKTLAHASNIRLRRSQDVITLVVGALDDNRGGLYGRVRATTTARPAGRPSAAPGPAPSTARNPAAALLILRATKADVDAFAKNQLTLAQFTEKVQTLFSPSISSVPASPATGPTPVGTRR